MIRLAAFAGINLILCSCAGSAVLQNATPADFNIGYSRASRLIDQMTDAGIVGDFKGSQAREVMITAAEWDSIRRRADREDAEQEELNQKNPVTQEDESQAEFRGEEEEEDEEEESDEEVDVADEYYEDKEEAEATRE